MPQAQERNEPASAELGECDGDGVGELGVSNALSSQVEPAESVPPKRSVHCL